jgi:hypothetical protein
MSLVVGRTRAGSSPASSNTARASPNQVVSPAAVPWCAARRSIVVTKFRPCSPYSQAVRTT